MSKPRNAKKPYSRPASRAPEAGGMWLHDKAQPQAAISNRSNQDIKLRTKLMVSNLHYEVTTKDLTQIFGQVGTLVREPLIRYDRSGRSSGVAIISYETPEEAKSALERFNEKLCKGQPMTITFDAGPPTRPQARRVASAPSLINRVQKAPLLDRLSQNATQIEAQSSFSGPGPVRNKARGGKQARGAKREPKKPKTAEELDMELDAFMKDDAPITKASAEVDVEMAT